MARDLLNRYIWFVDTIRRYGRITRAGLDECWIRSAFSNGRPMPRRTFHNYREAAQQMFNIEIAYDPATYEYYIEGDSDPHAPDVTGWLLNSAVTSELITSSRDVSSKIFLEDVPSAREFLASVIDALRHNRVIRFDYLPYTRSTPTRGVMLEPYFVKIFRQRWYVTGRHTGENRIKTYALDRMSGLCLTTTAFEPDPAFDAAEYVRHSFGVIFSDGEVRDVVIRAEPRQAKYMRALPLHHSQREFVHDGYSDFHYRLRITDDFVAEILSQGPRLTVMQPPELRMMIRSRLREALDAYDR